VREDRLLPHVDAWLCQLFSPEHIGAAAASVVEADSQRNEEDPEIVRARRVIAQCDRKLEAHLRGLEQGIPANLIAPRIEATQKEKTEATAVVASNRPKASPLTIEQVTETLSQLRDVPEWLAHIDQADRAELYRHLDIALTYKRENGPRKYV
jgi:site-specific DNA recombinase